MRPILASNVQISGHDCILDGKDQEAITYEPLDTSLVEQLNELEGGLETKLHKLNEYRRQVPPLLLSSLGTVLRQETARMDLPEPSIGPGEGDSVEQRILNVVLPEEKLKDLKETMETMYGLEKVCRMEDSVNPLKAPLCTRISSLPFFPP